MELMVTVAIMAIVAAMAYPSFADTLRSNYASTTTNELLGSLALARSEAIRANGFAGICPSATGTSCGGDWNGGWLVWLNDNGDGIVNPGERVLRYSQAKPKADVTSTATSINFDARGRATTGAQSITVTPKGSTTHTRCLAIGPTGQATIKDTCA